MVTHRLHEPEPLVNLNLVFLDQMAELVPRLSAEVFCRPEPRVFNSSIGQHLRHCIEHYQALVAGTASGVVNYEKRPRSEALETKPELALETLQRLKDDLCALSCSEIFVEDCGTGEAAVASSVERELLYLGGHTVHHLALVAVICTLSDIGVPADFGVARSPLAYRQRHS